MSRHPPTSISCVSIKALPLPFVVVDIPVYSLPVSEFNGFSCPFLFMDFETIQVDSRTQRFALCLFLLPLDSEFRPQPATQHTYMTPTAQQK